MTAQVDRSQLMRRRLLDAAGSAILELGYRGATAVAICQRANATRGALHHHFKNGKIDLMTALAEEIYEHQYREHAALAGDSPAHALLQYIDRYLRDDSDSEQLILVAMWQASRDTNEQPLASALEQLRDAHWLRIEQYAPPELAALGKLAAIFIRGYLMEEHLCPPSAARVDALRLLRELVAAELQKIPQPAAGPVV